jgi:hypothetical protein
MSQKHFESNQELIERFTEYLDDCEVAKKIPNLAGFARAMFCCKETLLNYRKPDHIYFSGMQMIYTYLEDATINNGMSDNFKKFYMVNTFTDYSDSTKVEANNVTVTQDISMFAPEERKKRIQELKQKLGE